MRIDFCPAHRSLSTSDGPLWRLKHIVHDHARNYFNGGLAVCFDQMQDSMSSGWSFTQGLLLGQLSVCVLLFMFIKFFIFGEVPSSYEARTRRRRLKSFSRPRTGTLSLSSGYNNHGSVKLSPALRTQPPLTANSILAKTYYNVQAHQPESVDWFNVLVAQTIAQLRHDAQQDNAILTSLSNLLNGDLKPSFLDEIRVTEINLGEEFPICSNCRIISVDDFDSSAGGGRPPSSSGQVGGIDTSAGRLQARMDVDLSDTITLGIETKLVLNYPKPGVLVMPVALAVSVVRFTGTLSISFIPSNSRPDDGNLSNNPSTAHPNRKPSIEAKDPTPPTTLTFSFLPDYRLELSTHSLLGSRSRLQDVPKIAQLLEARLHDWFDERCVEPRFQQIVLPSLWPRRRTTRGGTDSSGPETDGGGGAGRSRPVSREGPPLPPQQPQQRQASRDRRDEATEANVLHIPVPLRNGFKPADWAAHSTGVHAPSTSLPILTPNNTNVDQSQSQQFSHEHSSSESQPPPPQQQQQPLPQPRSRPAAKKSRLSSSENTSVSITSTGGSSNSATTTGATALPGPMPGSLPL